MALLAASDLKIELNIPSADTTWDVLLAILAPAVQNLYDELTYKTLEAAAFTEYYDGDILCDRVFLNNYPVSSSASLVVWDDTDWDFEDADIITAADVRVDYIRGILYYQYFNNGFQNIKVTYTAGYTADTLPKSKKEILTRQACHWFKQAKSKSWDVASLTTGAGTTSFKLLERNLLPDFVSLIERDSRG